MGTIGHSDIAASGGAAAPALPLGRSGMRRAPSRRASGRATPAAGGKLPLPIILLLVTLPLPWMIYIGPMRLSPYRIVLITFFLPSLLMLVQGKCGRIRLSDLAILGYCSWCFLALTVVEGLSSSIQPGGMIFVEAGGGYLMARCYIRSAEQFERTLRGLFTIILVLLPFSIAEAVTHQNYARELLNMIQPAFVDDYLGERLGLRRVQSVFEHPILYGVWCVGLFSSVHMVLGYGKSPTVKWLQTAAITLAAFLSLSAGPLSGLVAQAMLIGWNWLLREYPWRWKILWVFGIFVYVVITLLASHSVPVVFLTHFSFDQESAYYRVLIWTYGSASVLNHPLFGVGFGDWARPDWMTTSVDMMWIIDALRQGLPAELFLALAFFSLYLGVAAKKGLDEKLTIYRTAYLIGMTGFFLFGWTVSFWNATYVYFFFMMAAGAWLLDAGTGEAETPPRQAGPARGGRRAVRRSAPAGSRRAGVGGRNA